MSDAAADGMPPMKRSIIRLPMGDLVERLRAFRPVIEFNSAGVLEHYDASPPPQDLEAADEIERLRKALLNTVTAAVSAEREACALLIEAGEQCRHVDHVLGHCDCRRIADAIRSRSDQSI